MKHRIFTIFDKAAKAFQRPFTSPEQGIATRAIQDLVNEPGHELNKHPGDYTLYEIGTFDDNKGIVEPYPTPDLVMHCAAMVADNARPLFPEDEKVGGSD